MKTSPTKLFSWAIGATLAFSASASAQSVESFYRGNTVTVLIAGTPGGGFDAYSRLMAQHLPQFLPGKPNMVAKNMAGAGGLTLANHLYNVAARDGSVIAYVGPIAMQPLFNPNAPTTKFDPRRFSWIGSLASSQNLLVAWQTAPIHNPDDLFTTTMVVAGTGAASDTDFYPKVMNLLLGTKFKLVTGYKGSRDVTLAMERNEVQGICGLGWSTVKVQYPEVLSGNAFARVVAQEDLKGHPDLTAKGVPLMTTLATTDEERQALQMFYSQNAFSRTFILPPGVPDDRVKTVRAAFMDTMADPELLADAKKMNIDVGPSTGEDVQALVKHMYELPQPVIERVKKAMGR